MSATNTAVTNATEEMSCPRALAAVLERIGNKWTILVVGALGLGPQRFSAIGRTVGGISQRMLTLTLRNLEKDGIVVRTVYPTTPPRVEYALSELGQTLIEPLLSLTEWAKRYVPEMEAAAIAFDCRAA